MLEFPLHGNKRKSKLFENAGMRACAPWPYLTVLLHALLDARYFYFDGHSENNLTWGSVVHCQMLAAVCVCDFKNNHSAHWWPGIIPTFFRAFFFFVAVLT